jgi:serine/threonine protein kinase
MPTTGITWREAVRLIEAARSPADLFDPGDPTGSYRRLARLTHPDNSPAPASAFEKLAGLWTQHRERRNGSAVLVAEGDVANLYKFGDGLLKLPRDPADNDLIDREIAALTQLRSRGDARFLAYIPQLDGTERQRDPGTSAVRHACILGRLNGFVSLADVRRAYPDGLDPRDAAWMWRRLLVALGFAHRAGVVHGAVLPPHVMIHPADHGLVLIDWCYSACAPGQAIPAIVERYRDWYPAEVVEGRAPGPATDIYLATRCMVYLMTGRAAAGGAAAGTSGGGRGARGRATTAPARLTAFAGGCMLPQPSRRPQDAWRLLRELDALLERLYGPRTFRPFTMPGG